MAWSLDARIPLRLLDVPDAPPGAVVLAEDGAGLPPAPARVEPFAAPVLAAAAHPAGCLCCQPRSSVALALDRLFQARLRGQLPWFDGVVAVTRSAAGRAAILAALEQDSVTTARFRLAAGP